MEWALLVYVLSTSHLRVANVFEQQERCDHAAYAWKKHLPVDTLCLPVHREGVLANDIPSHEKTEGVTILVRPSGPTTRPEFEITDTNHKPLKSNIAALPRIGHTSTLAFVSCNTSDSLSFRGGMKIAGLRYLRCSSEDQLPSTMLQISQVVASQLSDKFGLPK